MKHRPANTLHISQNEGLIFEKSSPGKKGYKLPPLDVPEVDPAELLGSRAKDLGNMPEVSEIEIIRHFTRLSTWNYAVDHGMYPLGSCTMKYNPRVNECCGAVDGIAKGHPYQPETIAPGRAAHSEDAERATDRDHRHGRDHAATRGGRARRDDRPPDGAGVSGVARAMRARRF